MKMKKILSLLLSIISLNLAINFNGCFGMVPNDYSITEVTIPGFTNCPVCNSQRSSETILDELHGRKTPAYRTQCPGCGSVACIGHRLRYSLDIPKTNNELSCRYCGCRRFAHNGKRRNGVQQYRCTNCHSNGPLASICQGIKLQVWKQDFCKDCNRLDGFVSSKLIAGTKDIYKNTPIKKRDKVKDILSNPKGFKYYCYTCKKWADITLTGVQAKLVCSKYDRCLSLYALPSFRHMSTFLSYL